MIRLLFKHGEGALIPASTHNMPGYVTLSETKGLDPWPGFILRIKILRGAMLAQNDCEISFSCKQKSPDQWSGLNY